MRVKSKVLVMNNYIFRFLTLMLILQPYIVTAAAIDNYKITALPEGFTVSGSYNILNNLGQVAGSQSNEEVQPLIGIQQKE